jgi:transposase
MATIQIKCRYCNSEKIIKNGSNKKDGHQRYRCQNCRRSFQLDYTNNACKPAVKETIIDMAMNGSGVRDTARVLKIDIGTVISTLKKRTRDRIRKSALSISARIRD